MTELTALRALRDEAADLPCAETPLYALAQLERLDYAPPAPAVGAEMCEAQCHACHLRVHAIGLMTKKGAE